MGSLVCYIFACLQVILCQNQYEFDMKELKTETKQNKRKLMFNEDLNNFRKGSIGNM